MKHSPEAILQAAQAAYLDRVLPPREPLLVEMERFAAEQDIPISDPEVGQLLGILARGRRATRILEVGTAIGYGALCLARAVPEARVTTLERDPAMAAEARRFLARGGVATRVEVLEGDALELLPGLAGPVDLAYIDSDKTGYRRLLDLTLPKLSLGGLMVLDNLLWKGLVADPQDDVDEETTALEQFNPYFLRHPQLAALILPLGDGVGLGVKTQPTRFELGGPF